MIKYLLFLCFVSLNLYSDVYSVDLKEILKTTPLAQNSRDKIEKQLSPEIKKLEKSKKELESLASSIETQKSLLSKEALYDKQKEFSKKREIYLKTAKDFDNKYKKLNNDEINKIVVKVKNIIKEISTTKKIDAVIEKGHSNVIYSNDSFDLTSEILKKLN